MSKDVEIKKMVIKMGKKDVDLSIDEAKKLHEALDTLFGKKEVYSYPYWDWRWDRDVVYCNNSTSTLEFTADCNTVTCSL